MRVRACTRRGAKGVSSRAVPVRLGWGFEPCVAYRVGERQPEVQLARLVSVLGVAVRTHGEGARPRLQSQRRRPLHVEGEWLVGRRRTWLGIGSRSGSGSGSGAGLGLKAGLGGTRAGEAPLEPWEHAGRDEAIEGVQQRLVSRHLLRLGFG